MLEFLGHWFGLLCGQDADHTWAPGGLLLPCCQRCLGLYVGAGIAACLHWRLRPRLSGRFLGAHGMFLLLMAPLGFHWLPQGAVPRTVSGVLFGFGVATFLWLPVGAWAASRVFAPRIGTRHRAAAAVGQASRARWFRGRDARVAGSRFRIGTPPAGGTPAPLAVAGGRPAPLPAASWLARVLSRRGAEQTQAQNQCARPRALPAPPCRYAIALAATLVVTPLLAALGGTAAAYALAGLALGGAAALALLTLANATLFLSGAIHIHRRLKPPWAWQATRSVERESVERGASERVVYFWTSPK